MDYLVVGSWQVERWKLQGHVHCAYFRLLLERKMRAGVKCTGVWLWHLLGVPLDFTGPG